MKVSEVFNIVVEVGVVVFLLALLFLPFHVFARFAFPVFGIILVIFIGSLVHSLYGFAKGSQKRREGLQQQVPGKRILGMRVKTIFEWTLVIVALIVLWNFQKGNIGSKECPDFISSNEPVEIDIFYNPFCPACWTVEKKALALKGVSIVNYDVRYCSRHIELGLYGAPSFAIIVNNTVLEKGYGVERFEEAVRQWQ